MDNTTHSGMARVVERNIKTLLKRRREEEAKRALQEKIADAITHFTGSMAFVYIHLILFGTWILWNAGGIGLEPFDPSFVILAMFASVEAIFLSTFVLISQNRMNAQSDKRDELTLQITLLTEHELTRLITMVEAIAKKAEVELPDDVGLEEITKNIDPEKVMDAMEQKDRQNSPS
ncbi:hypothetical protein CHU92_13770 [Flavobacterium cyanobacteriorum]|uniref:DUF1003 domain-containing protein n=1 Tax=Flavobacterium cyanobacteriorum TaxID=2022802 RepID=A0A255YWF4_9FLAO|nr:DUF1003 domain-containing protein [Flavobacterium cyanobacteriorum]OYQ32985.1 hypothetical protein CHU92_13770 [Flavobacterium cyanobacteriorum]